VRAALETGVVITLEEHQTGGFGHRVLGVLAAHRCTDVVADLIGVNDRFGESGGPWELLFKFGLSAEHVAARARGLWTGRHRPAALVQAGKEN
jgi:transketolase